jgi:4-hydroxyphenylpyruvate dioxygenase-like putative hemolysin
MGNNWELAHVGLVVRDMDKTIEYYRSLDIGAEIGPERIGDNKSREVTRYGKIVDTEEKVRIRNIQIGPLSLLLNQPLEGRTHQQDFLDKNGGDGINHVAFWVDDLKSERAKMVAKGIQIMFEVEGNCYFDTRESGNVVIQLLQRK